MSLLAVLNGLALVPPTPLPMPTPVVRVYITVPPAPVPPAADIDPIKDVLFGDFGGAVTTVIATVFITRWLLRRERTARLDDRRRDLAEALSAALTQLLHAVGAGNAADMHSAFLKVSEATIPLAARERRDPHSNFRDWLEYRSRKISEMWAAADMHSPDFRKQLTKMVAGIETWKVDPEGFARTAKDDLYRQDGIARARPWWHFWTGLRAWRRSTATVHDGGVADAWTVEDAVAMLDPKLNTAEVRAMIDLFAIPSHGSRRTGRRGRPLPTYDPSTLQEAHAVVMRARVDLGRFRTA